LDTHDPALSQPRPANPVTASDEPATASGFFVRHGVTLLMVVIAGALLVYFFLKVEDSIDKLLAGLKVAVGLGVVIFIHELGHFVAAKLCDVHVETFSIGFGPPFLGLCAFKRGETTYKLAWFPLGGYVKMLGEGETEEGSEDDPRSFKNKPVWQRMVIISAGVAMNVLLAVACFIFVYMTHGVNQRRGVIGHVEPGGAAWKKGLTPGTYIAKINGKRTRITKTSCARSSAIAVAKGWNSFTRRTRTVRRPAMKPRSFPLPAKTPNCRCLAFCRARSRC